MDYQKALKFSIEAGASMLKNGAETTRVEDTMIRILRTFDLESDVFATPTGVFASVIYDDNIETMVRRINKRTTNLDKISLINSLSRDLVNQDIDLNQAIEELKIINTKEGFNSFSKLLASGAASSCFAFIFGGSFRDSLNAFITGFILYILLIALGKRNVMSPLYNIIGAAFASILSFLLVKLGIGDNVNMSVIGVIMILAPGVAFTNAVRDIMAEEYLSGTVRMVDAVLIAVSIAAGVGIGLSFAFFIMGDVIPWF